MIADGDLSYEAVAGAVGISQPTLRKWREHPEFRERVEAIREDYREHVRRRGIAVKERRVASLNERHRLMMDVIRERSQDPRMADIPGGLTGLVVITDWKRLPKPKPDAPRPTDDAGIKDDDEPPLVPVVEFDAALLRELRAHEEQAAKELGQWTERKEVTGLGGGPLLIGMVEVVAPADADDDDQRGA